MLGALSIVNLIAERDLLWWRDKANRRGTECFNETVAHWAEHALVDLAQRKHNPLEANSLAELSAEIGVPRKYLSRALATLTRCGLVTADLRSKPVIQLVTDTFPKRKGSAQIARGHIPLWMKKLIFSLEDYQCSHCLRVLNFNQLHVDHIVPVSLLGVDEPGNWVTMCAPCNRAKLDRFERVYLNKYRGNQVSRPIQLRFYAGFFWPVIDGRLMLTRRKDLAKPSRIKGP